MATIDMSNIPVSHEKSLHNEVLINQCGTYLINFPRKFKPKAPKRCQKTTRVFSWL